MAATTATEARHAAYDQELRRGYTRTRFGLVHWWMTGRGPFLTLLHQASQSADEYSLIAPFLSDSYRVLAIDMPGHGRSDNPSHELSVEEFIEATFAVMDDLGIDRTHVVGHHSGASLAIGIAAEQPERLDKMVLSGVGIRTEERTQAFFNTPLTRDLPIDTDGDFLSKTWDVYRRMSAPETPPEVSFLPFLVALQARIRTYDAHYAIMRWDRQSYVDRVDRSALFLEGEFDSFVYRQEDMMKHLPGSSRKFIEGCGAFMFYEKPEAIAEVLLEYLDS